VLHELLDTFTHALHDKDAAAVIATLSDEVVAFDLAPPFSPLSLYEGFVEIQPDQSPKTAALLVGHQDSFEELFGFPHTHQRR
jgi:hypothetical protein